MEEGVSCIRPTHASLQIIISILTIIKIFINFYENEISALLIIDIIINFIILIVVILSPFFEFKHSCFLCILLPCWFVNIITGSILSNLFVSNEFLGIYYFVLFSRVALIFLFTIISGFYHDKSECCVY